MFVIICSISNAQAKKECIHASRGCDSSLARLSKFNLVAIALKDSLREQKAIS